MSGCRVQKLKCTPALGLSCTCLRQWLNSMRPDAAVIWADLTKFGRLTGDAVNDVAEVMRKLLAHEPGIMVGVLIIPILASAKLARGIRGEIRLLAY